VLSRVERAHRRYQALVATFAVASLLFGVAVVAALQDDGEVVPLDANTASVDVGGGAATTTTTGGVGVPVGGAAAATGAGSSSGGAGPGLGADGATTTPPAAPTVAGDAPAALAPGEEVVVASVVSETGPVSFPSVAATLRAYFGDLNARGGINGHPVRLELYDDGLDTTRSRQAFRRIANDPAVIAVVGSFAPLGEPEGVDLLDAAGIPVITASGLAPSTFQRPSAYFLTGTLENYGRVACGEALRRGQRRVALVYVASEQIVPIIDAYADCIRAAGGAVLEEQTQLGQPDYTATAIRIGQFGADVVFHELAQSATVQLWRAMDRQGVVAANQLVPGSDIDLIRTYDGPAGRDVTIQTNVVPPHMDVPAIAHIKDVVERYNPGVPVTSLAVDKWVGAELFELVATRAGQELTRQRLLTELSQVSGFDGGGLVPPFSYGPDRRTTDGLFYFFDKVDGAWGPVGPPRGPG
jgi:branched-chain amino acid transport system substrate-binding protein